MKCPQCDYTSEKLISLSVHFRKRHGTAKDLYVQLNCDGKVPVCKCGCGVETHFADITRGFSDFIQGHHSRVHNNWGHNEKALEKSHAATRERYAKGEIETWCKGKTKETDERLAELGRKASATIRANARERKNRSDKMKVQWQTKNIVTLYGPAHSQWNGGTSSLSAYCHGNRKLYTEWKFPKLQAANFSCSKCGSPKDLCVHHDKEQMADIIRRHAEEFGYEGQDDVGLKSAIAESVAEYHVRNKVSGVVLCYDCHKFEHESLNFPRLT